MIRGLSKLLLAVCLLAAGCEKPVLNGDRYTLEGGGASMVFPQVPQATNRRLPLQLDPRKAESYDSQALVLALAPPDEAGNSRVLRGNEFDGAIFGENGESLLYLARLTPKNSMTGEEFENWRRSMAGTQFLFSDFTTSQGKTWRWFRHSAERHGYVHTEAIFTYLPGDALVVAYIRGPFTEKFVQEIGSSLEIDS